MSKRSRLLALMLAIITSLCLTIIPAYAASELTAGTVPASGEIKYAWTTETGIEGDVFTTDSKETEFDASKNIAVYDEGGNPLNVSDCTGISYDWYKGSQKLNVTSPKYTIKTANAKSSDGGYNDLYYCKVSISGVGEIGKYWIMVIESGKEARLDSTTKIRYNGPITKEELELLAVPHDNVSLEMDTAWVDILQTNADRTAFTALAEGSSDKETVLSQRVKYDWYKGEQYKNKQSETGNKLSFTATASDFAEKLYYFCDIKIKPFNGEFTNFMSELTKFTVESPFAVIDEDHILAVFNTEDKTDFYSTTGEGVELRIKPELYAEKYVSGEWVEDENTDAYKNSLSYAWERADGEKLSSNTESCFIQNPKSDDFTKYYCKVSYNGKLVLKETVTLNKIAHKDIKNDHCVEVVGNEVVSLPTKDSSRELNVLDDYPSGASHKITVYYKASSSRADWLVCNINDYASHLSYAWRRDGSTISGANSSKYTVNYSDVGKTISCRVSYDGEYVGSINYSINNDASFIAGDYTYELVAAGTNVEMKASYTTDAGELDVRYQWAKYSAEKGKYVDIAGANSSTLTEKINTNGDYCCTMVAVREEGETPLVDVQYFSYDAFVDKGILTEDTDTALTLEKDVLYRYSFKPDKSAKYALYSKGNGSPSCIVQEKDNESFEDWTTVEETEGQNFNIVAKLEKDTADEPHEYYLYIRDNNFKSTYTAQICAYSDVIDTVRLFGANRYETSVNIASYGVNELGMSSDTVILARGDNFPDALAASALAGIYDAPILLSDSKTLTDETRVLLGKLKPKNIIAVGGTASISENVLKNAASAAGGAATDRLKGANRYETATNISTRVVEMNPDVDTCIVTTGEVFADALSISPYAFSEEIPIYLVGSTGVLDEATIDAMESAGFDKMVIVGGTSRVKDEVKKQVTTRLGKDIKTIRLGKADRYSTSLYIAKWLTGQASLSFKASGNFKLKNGAGFATGENFPDALAACGINGTTKSPLILVNSGEPTDNAAAWLKSANSTRRMFFYGGTSALPNAIGKSLIEAVDYSDLWWYPDDASKYSGVKYRNK